MTQPIERDPIYRRRRFQTETVELCVRWYITYRLSYRDLAAMMAERGIVVSHTTVMRYVPEYEKRWNRFARPVNSSWRMDETAVSVRGGLHYLYPALVLFARTIFPSRQIATHLPGAFRLRLLVASCSSSPGWETDRC